MSVGLDHDISTSSLLISGVIALAGWIVRGAAKLLAAAIKLGIQKAIELISRIDSLDKEVQKIFTVLATVEKNRSDLNEYYSRLKKLEDDFQTLKQ